MFYLQNELELDREAEDWSVLLGDMCPDMQGGAEWRMSSPLFSPMQAGHGNPCLNSGFYSSGLTSSEFNIPSQYGTNVTEMDMFLDSVLNDPDEQSYSDSRTIPSLDSTEYLNVHEKVILYAFFSSLTNQWSELSVLYMFYVYP